MVPEQKEAYFIFYHTVPSKIETQSIIESGDKSCWDEDHHVVPESLYFGDTVRPVLV